ncbi:hypothetical protein BKA66DRAFT_573993 [Pyrenochaeta sp. MPI-SDFR-AT-0127]|nr:hypothetical protein BKA66DRAFT_573993 [Pyrenochaeta sp. MPI-SDFR-AT-0127]
MQPADSSLAFAVGELPNELLIAIVIQLEVRRGYLVDPEPETERQRDNNAIVRALHSLALTCRMLNSITTPLLFQCVIQPPDRVCTTKLLLRTLSSRPDLSRYVQYIECHSCPMELEDTLPQHYTDTDLETYERLLAGARWTIPYMNQLSNSTSGLCRAFDQDDEIRHRQRSLWIGLAHYRERDRQEFAVATLISIAENLSEVALNLTSTNFNILGSKQYPVGGGLSRTWFRGRRQPHTSFHTFKANPSLQHNPLADFLCWEYVGMNREAFLELEEISINTADLRVGHVSNTLAPCRAVKRFACRWIGDTMEDPDRLNYLSEVNLPALRRELYEWKTSFESVTIDTMDSSWLVSMDVDIPAFGTFRDFTSLKYLYVSGLVLWGDCHNLDYPRLSNILPDSLETIGIKTEWDDDVEGALHNLYEDRSTMLSRLRRVECTWRPAPKVAADYLMEAFIKHGVDLVLSIADDGSNIEV